MNNNQQTDPWCIIEDGFDLSKQIDSESLFSLSNGYMLQRANFEEYYSGNSVPGSYIAGVYCPDSNQTGTKGDGEENNNRLLNTPSWVGIIVRLNDEVLDLATWKVQNFRKVLNMHEGYLERTFEATSLKGHKIHVAVKRFLSMAENQIGAISYSVKSLDFEGRISFMPVINAEVKNPYVKENEQSWNVLQIKTQQEVSHLWAQARRMNFHVCSALTYVLYKNNEQVKQNPTKIEKEKIAGYSVGTDVRAGDTVCLNKYVAIIDSLNHEIEGITDYTCEQALNAKHKGWNKLFEEHTTALAEKWSQLDVSTKGDIKTQQAARHKIFMNNINLDKD